MSSWARESGTCDDARRIAAYVATDVFVTMMIKTAAVHFSREEMDAFNECLILNFKNQCPEKAILAEKYMEKYLLQYCREDFVKKPEVAHDPA